MSSQGVYGTRVPAMLNIEKDVDIYYNYRAKRSNDSTVSETFKKLNSSILSQSHIELEDESPSLDTTLEGAYNLRFPTSVFNQKGFYTVYIKPKEHYMNIQDIGTLVTYPDIRGIVLDLNKMTDINSDASTNNSLVGYRIIYFDDNGARLPYYRLITSNNRCEPVVQNLADTNQKAVRYRYNDSSSLIFLTVTPSTAPTFKSTVQPFIGKVSQRIALVNTAFEPIMIDIEMVDKDIETVSTMLEGSQLRDLDNSLITTFNENNEIYHQSEHYTLKDSYTATPIFEVKKQRNNSIDYSQTLDGK